MIRRIFTLMVVLMGSAITAQAQTEGPLVNQSTCLATWTAPQSNTDGSNLADLKEYGLYVAPTRAALAALTAPLAIVAAPELDPPAGKTGVWPCATLALGQWYIQVDAVDTASNRSARSGVAPFVLRDAVSPQAPGTPTLGP